MKVALALVFVGLLAVAAATEEEEFSLLKRVSLFILKKIDQFPCKIKISYLECSFIDLFKSNCLLILRHCNVWIIFYSMII